jgi:hypothetical protein
MADEAYWENRAFSAEAQLETLRQASSAALDRVKEFKGNYGIREKSDGSLQLNYDILASGLGIEGALELRAIIDAKYNISGAAGEKPRIRLKTETANDG